MNPTQPDVARNGLFCQPIALVITYRPPSPKLQLYSWICWISHSLETEFTSDYNIPNPFEHLSCCPSVFFCYESLHWAGQRRMTPALLLGLLHRFSTQWEVFSPKRFLFFVVSGQFFCAILYFHSKSSLWQYLCQKHYTNEIELHTYWNTLYT